MKNVTKLKRLYSKYSSTNVSVQEETFDLLKDFEFEVH